MAYKSRLRLPAAAWKRSVRVRATHITRQYGSLLGNYASLCYGAGVKPAELMRIMRPKVTAFKRKYKHNTKAN
jgi:hypothetical protein